VCVLFGWRSACREDGRVELKGEWCAEAKSDDGSEGLSGLAETGGAVKAGVSSQ
jgi:hypothetical protein